MIKVLEKELEILKYNFVMLNKYTFMEYTNLKLILKKQIENLTSCPRDNKII